MQKNTRNISLIILSVILLPFHLAQAVCPICTIAVGAGIGFSRYLGIDDAITGAWIGGLIVSMSLWTNNWLISKGKEIKLQKAILLVVFYALVIIPLFWQGTIGHPLNKIYGMDKIVFGVIFGSLAFYWGSEINLKLKERNGGKVHFPFQKVALGIAPLIFLSLIFFLISKRW